jgi:membrane protease YdiL (CAAX protease family)
MPNLFERMGIPVELGERRFLHPGPLRWLRTTGWMVLLFALVGLSSYPVQVVATPWLASAGDAEKMLAGIVASLMAVGVYTLGVWLAEARLPSELAPSQAVSGILIGLSIGALLFSTVMAVLLGLGLYDFVWKGAAPAWVGGTLAIESGVIEEVLARAVLLRLLWRAFGPWTAFILSAAVFGAGHLTNPNSSVYAATCIAIEAGILLGAFYALTGRVWVSIGLHAGWNFTQGYLFGAAVSGGDFGAAIAQSTARAGHPDWLTGGRFGPEASLPALLICSAVGFTTLGMAWKAGRFGRAEAAVSEG